MRWKMHVIISWTLMDGAQTPSFITHFLSRRWVIYGCRRKLLEMLFGAGKKDMWRFTVYKVIHIGDFPEQKKCAQTLHISQTMCKKNLRHRWNLSVKLSFPPHQTQSRKSPNAFSKIIIVLGPLYAEKWN